MAKHLIDLDEAALSAARAEFGTSTIKETVNNALRLATSDREDRIDAAFERLAAAEISDREEMWR